MKLKATERSALLRGELPALSRDFIVGEPQPFDPGEEIVLKRVGGIPQVWLTINVVKRGKKGQWEVEYTFRDDRPLYLRHNHEMTRSASESVDPEAPIIDPDAHKTYSLEARAKWAERTKGDRAEKQARIDTRRLAAQIRDVLVTQARLGIDSTEFLANLQRMIREQMEEREAA